MHWVFIIIQCFNPSGIQVISTYITCTRGVPNFTLPLAYSFLTVNDNAEETHVHLRYLCVVGILCRLMKHVYIKIHGHILKFNIFLFVDDKLSFSIVIQPCMMFFFGALSELKLIFG